MTSKAGKKAKERYLHFLMKKTFSHPGIATLTLLVLSGCCSPWKNGCGPAGRSRCCRAPKKAANQRSPPAARQASIASRVTA